MHVRRLRHVQSERSARLDQSFERDAAHCRVLRVFDSPPDRLLRRDAVVLAQTEPLGERTFNYGPGATPRAGLERLALEDHAVAPSDDVDEVGVGLEERARRQDDVGPPGSRLPEVIGYNHEVEALDPIRFTRFWSAMRWLR